MKRAGHRISFSDWELANLSWDEIGKLAIVRLKKAMAGVNDGKGRPRKHDS